MREERVVASATDLRGWLDEVDRLGQLRTVEGASPDLEIGIISEINAKRRGPALLFDRVQGYQSGYRILTGALLNARRLALTLGLPEVESDQALVGQLGQRLLDYETRARDFPVKTAADTPVTQCRQEGTGVDLGLFPAPRWHEHDGGSYLGTGCVVITRDPDTGVVNLGTYRLMLQDARTVTLHISGAHHGRLNLNKYHQRGEPAPVAVSLGHHPLFFLLGGMSLPYSMSEYEYIGAIRGAAVGVFEGERTGLPLPADSEIILEGFCPPDEMRDEGPFGEYTGYYASGRGKEHVLQVQSVYHRPDPIVLGAMPGRPPHDYSYFMSALKSANVKQALEKDGVPDVRGVWYHEVAGVNFFVVVSIRQRYPGHARQAALMAAQCRAAATSLGRYVVVVDEDIDPSDLEQVIWAVGTRSNPATDIDVLRNTYTNSLDPIAPKGAKAMFGARAIIDACKPYDWIEQFPQVAESSPARRQEVRDKWKHLFSDGAGGAE